jgi:hypothetical protein
MKNRRMAQKGVFLRILVVPGSEHLGGEPLRMSVQNKTIQRATILAVVLLTTLWLSAQPKSSAEQVFEEIDEIRPHSVLLVPPQGQAVDVTKNNEVIEKFFKSETPGRLFLMGRGGAVIELSHNDGKWSVVRVDGSQVAIDEESFSQQLAKIFDKAKAQGQFTACTSNLKNLGTALEMYSTDYKGKYPPVDSGLSLLTPNYLKTIPACPAAGKVTYSYTGGPDAALNGPGYQDYMELRCVGSNHKAVGVQGDLPAYTGVYGLIGSDEELAEVAEDAEKERQARARKADEEY